MEGAAKLKGARLSAQKARLVADVVRGMDVDSAITTLKYMPKKGARLLRKVIESAVANAIQTEKIDADTLYISMADQCSKGFGLVLWAGQREY